MENLLVAIMLETMYQDWVSLTRAFGGETPARRKPNDDNAGILFDAHQTLRYREKKICYCESEHCKHCFGKGCGSDASGKKCDYIGDICDACAEHMPSKYMLN